MVFLEIGQPMSVGPPDTSLLPKLLRERISSSRWSPTGMPAASRQPLPADVEQRSSAVIGALMRDTREAFERHQITRPTVEAAIVKPAGEAPPQLKTDPHKPGDLSIFMLNTLNYCHWQEWVAAHCNFPDKGPFVSSGCDAALAALAALTQQMFNDAGEDGDDLSVEIFTESVSGSARLTVSGPFTLSMKTLQMIKHSRSELETTGGALVTLRASNTAGFEALIPEH